MTPSRGDLNQDFQEQKCSSAALVPVQYPWKSRVSRGPAPFECCPPSGAAAARRQAAAAPRRVPKLWLIRVRLLVPAPPAWTINTHTLRGGGGESFIRNYGP
jgi:hypothetical protein